MGRGGGLHLKQVASESEITYRDKQPFTLTLTPTVSLESPVCTSVGSGKKLEYSQTINIDKGRTWQLYTERTRASWDFKLDPLANH